MTPLPRWLDEAGPEDSDLRDALRDARRGPSAAQVAALAARVAERAAARSEQTERERPRRRGAVRATVWGVLGASVLMALWWIAKPDAPAQVVPKTPARVQDITPTPSDVDRTESAPSTLVLPTEVPPTPARVVIKQKRTVRSADPARGSEPQDELALLQSASRLLMAQPARALALTQRHQQLFGSSMFSEEREAVAIEALWRLGNHDEARARRQLFDSRFPTSTYRQRLDSVAKR